MFYVDMLIGFMLICLKGLKGFWSQITGHYCQFTIHYSQFTNFTTSQLHNFTALA